MQGLGFGCFRFFLGSGLRVLRYQRLRIQGSTIQLERSVFSVSGSGILGLRD